MTNIYLGKDILLVDNDILFSNNQDFSVTSDINNLKQAIINRLKTNKGEYINKYYGSEIYKIKGKPQNSVLKNLIIGYIYECLLQEPRIKNIENINVNFKSTDEIEIILDIVPIQTETKFNLIFPYFIN